MRKFLLSSVTTVSLLAVSPLAYANGNGFGGSFLGALVGGVVGNALTQPAQPPPQQVYVAPPVVYQQRVVVVHPVDQEMVAVQNRLKALGLLPWNAAADGVAGPQTQQAIANWQRSVNEPMTGFLNPVQAQELFAPPQVQAPQPAASPQPIAPPTPIAAPVQQVSLPTSSAHVLGQWSGNGLMITSPFHTDGPWLLEWDSSAGFGVQLIKDGVDQGALAAQSSAGQSSSYVATAGDYSLKISADGPWTLRSVESQQQPQTH